MSDGPAMPGRAAGAYFSRRATPAHARRARAVRLRAACIAIALLVAPPSAAQETNDTSGRSAGAPEVAELEIAGVQAFDESDLRDILETRESPWLPWRDPAYFDAAVFEQDLDRIEEWYEERGFPDAEAEGTVDRRDGGVRLRIVVREGEPVRIEEVVFTGFDVLPAEERARLQTMVPLQPEQPLAAPDVEAATRLASRALWDAGYAYAEVEVLRTNIATRRVRVEVRATPGLQTSFGRIDIAGNQRTDDTIIRREVAYRPGEPFAVTPIEITQRRLLQLGLFESVDIEFVEPENLAEPVSTRIVVKEGDQTQFTWSGGYGSEEQAYGEAEWRHLNFLGDARRLSIRGRWSWVNRGVETTFLEPYLAGRDWSLDLAAYGWNLDEPIYEAWSLGGQAGVTYSPGRAVLSGRYIHQFERVQLSDALRTGAVPALLPGVDSDTLEQEGLLSAVQFNATYDATTSSTTGRTGGYYATARIEQAGGWLPGAFGYYQLFGDARYYHSIAGLTLAGRLQYGSIDPLEASAGVPFSRRFFLGGAGTLRGWGRLEVSPLSPSGLPIGGHSLLAATGELRFPVLGPVSGALFADAGNVWADPWELHPGDLRSDAGGGLRYASPFGLLRLDYAYQLTPIEGLRPDGQPEERRWRIHFSVGQAF